MLFRSDLEYLYVEEGDFTLLSGQQSPALRRSVYRYVEATDTLSEWVVNPSDGVAVYRAHELEFGEVGGEDGEDEACVTARATGLRAEDDYSTDYCFEFRAVALRGWEVMHEIGAAGGAYISITTYKRPGEDS